MGENLQSDLLKPFSVDTDLEFQFVQNAHQDKECIDEASYLGCDKEQEFDVI